MFPTLFTVACVSPWFAKFANLILLPRLSHIYLLSYVGTFFCLRCLYSEE
jgi:hypothetical protein